MKHKIKHLGLVLLLTLLLSASLVAAVGAVPAEKSGTTFPALDWLHPRAPINPAADYTTIITVTTTADPDDDQQYVCYTEGLTGKTTRSPCTLRQALEESESLPESAQPILIRFELPNSESHNNAGDYWVIQLYETGYTNALPDVGNQTTIDGSTQTGGRSGAPQIIIRGPEKVPNGYGLILEEDSTIRGLAFQRLRMHIQLNGSNNVVEDCWFGLSDDGQDFFLRDPEHPEDGSGQSGISTADNNTNNRIQNNHLTHFRAAAINVRGDESFVLSNTVGTLADGTVPEVRADRKCKSNAFGYNWFPGAGVNVSGHNNQVVNNRIVGMLFYSEDPFNTPDNALDISGHDHVVHNNIIGLTSDGVHFGTCGEGIHIGGIMGAYDLDVRDNHVVGSQGAAGIEVTGGPYGYDVDAVTIQGNIIEDSAHAAFKFGDTMPSELRDFNPAAVTGITVEGGNTTISGSSGADSPCAGCEVEVFLDKYDEVNETLDSLAVVTADANGDWTASITGYTLALTEGVRTASTTVTDSQIPHPSAPKYIYHAGMTTKISDLYTQTNGELIPPPADPGPYQPITQTLVSYSPPPTLPRTYSTTHTTILTVTSAGDPNDSKTEICYDEHELAVYVPKSPCTLRRAILESEKLAAAYRDEEIPNPFPILISFNISTTDNYDPVGQYWTIQLTETGELNALPYLGDMTAIVGDTQPGGRTDGPKIVVRGPEKVPAGYGLVIDSDSTIQGLAFQRLRMHLQLNGGGNIIEDNWFGLTSDGQDIFLRDVEHPEDGSGQSGVTTVENVSGNLLKNNVLAGFRGGAIALRSNDSYVVGNYVGVNADGEVPVDVPANRWCKPNARYSNWFGGAGIDVSGKRAQIGGPNPEDGNIIAAMLIYGDSPFATPPTALSLSRQEHLIQNNVIGTDKNGQEIGTCGYGIVVDAPRTRVLSNTVTRSGMIGLFSGGTRYNSNSRTMQDNIIKDSTTLFDFGPGIPEELQIFTPTQVLAYSTSDTTISGVNGHRNAPCPYCTVEIYLDDLDGISETLELMATATTDENGEWSANLPHTIAITQGLRTAVTALNYDVIPDYDTGTTSRFSTIFSPTGAITIAPPEQVPPLPPTIPEVDYAPPPTAPYHYTPTFNTIITVTTARDPKAGNDWGDEVCYEELPLTFVGPQSPCSLRRAVREAKKIAEDQPGALPVLIKFAIPITDNYSTDFGGYWTIVLSDTGELDALPELGRQTVLDGDTQPGGRTDGPKIVVRGPENVPEGYGLRLYGDGNLIRGLAFQRFRMHMFVGGNGNIIEDNWFGLSDDGLDLVLRDPDHPEDGTGQSGIRVAENISNTLIQRNVIAGFRGGAMNVGSNDSYILGNIIGLNAEGTLPFDVTYNRQCHPNARYYNWFGGAGVDISGKRNQVISNTLAGLLIRGEDPEATPPEALAIYGRDHLVQSNVIGLDTKGKEIGTCGVGLRLKSDFTRFFSNTIAHSGGYALYQSGTRYESNARTLQGNLAENSDTLLEFDPGIPEEFQIFTPTQITDIVVGAGSTTLSGANGKYAPCPYCQVEVFIDDLDDTPELLESVLVTQTHEDGTWSAVLNRALAITEGLRTASTPRDYGIIEPYYEAGSTSRFSELYTQPNPPTPPDDPDPAPIIPPAVPPITYTDPPTLPSAYNTTITVDTTDDSDTSSTRTCTSAGAGNCSLRFAINEASDLDASERPARIAFNIPTGDSGHASGVWTINLNTNRDLPPVEGGDVVIDGTSQPGYDGSRPIIIIHCDRESSTGAHLEMGETQFETGYGVQGLAFQGLGISLGYGSVAQDNWLGLNDDGNTIYFPDDVSKVNYAIIKTRDHCLVKNNVLAGSSTVAIHLNGDDNVVEGNRVGTRADGTIDVTGVISICDPTATSDNWFGGGGIDLAGYRNRIRDNTIVGLLIEGSANSTPPNAIDIGYGEYDLIENNRIGIDANDNAVWTCGDGIKNYGTAYTRIFSNTVVNSFGAGVYIEGRWWDSNANTLQGNVISNSIRAIYFGDLVPDELALFSPAIATVISGTEVTGISDDDCPYCYVDVYLDDDDPWTEALEYWGTTTADVNGDWTFRLPRELTENEGLRTLSTVRNYGVIKNYEIGSSSKLSILFKERPPAAPAGVDITPPTPDPTTGELWADKDLYFLAQVSPVTSTLPISYVWEATGLVSQTVRGGVEKAVAFNWDSPGVKTVKVTATGYNNTSVVDTVDVTITNRVPLASANIDGPDTVYEDIPYTFDAIPNPLDATEHISYTWAPEPQSGQETSTATYQWPMTGTYVITVTAQNYGGIYTTTHTIEVEEGLSCYEVSDVALTVITTGTLDNLTSVEFSADISPDYASTPYNYAVDYGDGLTEPATSSDDPLIFEHTFGTPGTHEVKIGVWNCEMVVPLETTVDVVIEDSGVCVDLTGITIEGNTSGAPGEYTFNTTLQPTNATSPSYLWDNGDTTASSIRTLDVGTHTLAITATNCTSALVTDTHTLVVSEGATCTEVSNVDLAIATVGTIYTDTEVTFNADITPDDAGNPYNYTIDYGDGVSTTMTSSADSLVLTHTFASTGTFPVEISVWNCTMAEPVTATVEVIVFEQGVCVDLTSITIAGETTGAAGTYTFTNSYLPTYASLPIAYLWDNGDTTATSIRALDAGTHTLAITATNCTSAIVTDTHTIVLTGDDSAYDVYLPLVLRMP